MAHIMPCSSAAGRLQLVKLASSERLRKGSASTPADTKATLNSLSTLGEVLSTLAARGQGQGQPAPYANSTLTRLLKDTLKGSCHVSLLATINPQPDNYEECFNTLQFAAQCQGLQAVPQIMGAASEQQRTEGSMQQLTQQVAELQHELDFTHAHYQKLIESVAGPRWLQDPGPLERPEGPPNRRSGPGVASVRPSQGAALAEEANCAGSDEGETGAASSMPPRQSLQRSVTSMSALEIKIKRVEAQLHQQQSKLAQSQSRLTTKRVEAMEFRQRMVSKHTIQADEMMRLRQEVKDHRAALSDCEALSKHREAVAKHRFDEECARLRVDNEALVAQLAAMSASVSSMSEPRGGRGAAGGQQQQQQMTEEAERKLKQQVAMSAGEKDHQIDVVKQQSTYHLSRKAEEIRALQHQLEELQTNSEAETQTLKAEAQLAVDYAVRTSEVLRQLEAGLYGPVERMGLKQLQVPSREKAQPEDRIRYLRSALHTMDKLATATAAAATPPSHTPSHMGNTSSSSTLGFGSRIQSAGTTHSTTPITAFTHRPTSGMGRPDDALGSGPPSAHSLNPAAADLESALRAHWEATHQEAIKKQVLSEMKNDKTVEYIRSLESQVARYRQDLQVEQRRCTEMTVALRSVQRLAQNNPNSSVIKTLTGSESRSSRGSWGFSSPVGTPTRPRGLPLATGDSRAGTAGTIGVGVKVRGSGARGGVVPLAWSGSASMRMSTSPGSSANGGFIRETGY